MTIRRSIRMAAFGTLVLIVASVYTATAATNIVPPSGLGDQRSATTANDLKPPECSAINVTNKIQSSGTINGTSANDLILGSALRDTIDGAGGRDCIVGGGGNDGLKGASGDDVLLGGPGDDSLNGGDGTDVCYGGDGNDTFEEVLVNLLGLLHTCETRIQ